MIRARIAAIVLLSLISPGLAPAAEAPAVPPPADLQPWPYPPPDPQSWWTDAWPAPDDARDPLAGRRIDAWGEPARVDNGVDPLLYRLWGLPPLQSQILYGDEAIMEAWARPARGVRQAVVRVILRRDGRGFVQARAGLACCEPEIGRRVDINAELPAEALARLRAIRGDGLWAAPRHVRVIEAGGAQAICVDGTAYDLTRVTSRGAVTVRRACDRAEVGQAANVLSALLGAALGRDGRFDVVFPQGADFSAERSAYEALIEGGGGLRKAPPRAAARP